MIDNNQFISKIDRFYIKFEIDESIKSLKSESTLIDDQIWISDSMTSIRFGDANRISLVQSAWTGPPAPTC